MLPIMYFYWSLVIIITSLPLLTLIPSLHFLGFVQIIGGLCFLPGYAVQIHHNWKTKNVIGLNFWYVIAIYLGISLMEAYAIKLYKTTGEASFLITNTISLFLSLIIVIQKLFYNNNNNHHHNNNGVVNI